jgi:hypothetical protein
MRKPMMPGNPREYLSSQDFVQLMKPSFFYMKKQLNLFGYFLSLDIMVRYTAYIGWVGKIRPSLKKTVQPGSADLLAYLSKCNLTFENFNAMRQGMFPFIGAEKIPKGKKPPRRKVKPGPYQGLGREEAPTRPIAIVQEITGRPNSMEISNPMRKSNFMGGPNQMERPSFTERPNQMERPSFMQSPNHMERSNIDGRPSPNQKPSVKERLGTKVFSDSGFCGTCGNIDENDPKRAIETGLIRAVSTITSPNDPKVEELLKTQEQVDFAMKLTSILSKALSKRFDKTQFQLQQISNGMRSDHSGTSSRVPSSRSPLRDYRSRSPMRDYKSRSPMRDHRSRSPMRDHRSRSPMQDYRRKSPVQDYRPRLPEHDLRPTYPAQNYRSPMQRIHPEEAEDYHKEKYGTGNRPTRTDGDGFDQRHTLQIFSSSSNQSQRVQPAHNFFLGADGDNRRPNPENVNIF